MSESYVEVLDMLKVMDRNTSFVSREYKRLQSKYGDEYIAVDNGKVIAHEKSYENLRSWLADKKLEIATVLVKYIPEKGALILY